MARKLGSHSEITGPRITSAATTLIARHGFAAVTMRQIAAEVGVQAGALYLYTPDKQTLLFDLMRAHMEELLDAAAAEDFSGPPEAAQASNSASAESTPPGFVIVHHILPRSSNPLRRRRDRLPRPYTR